MPVSPANGRPGANAGYDAPGIDSGVEMNQAAQIEEAFDLVDVGQRRRTGGRLLATHVLEQQRAENRRHAALDLQPHRDPLSARRRRTRDLLEQIVGVLLIELDLGASRHSERVRMLDGRVGIERAQVAAYHLLDRYSVANAVLRRPRGKKTWE